MVVTATEKNAVMGICFAIRDAIKELCALPEYKSFGIPSGEFYVKLGKFSVTEYQFFLDILIAAKQIQVKSHCITYIGK